MAWRRGKGEAEALSRIEKAERSGAAGLNLSGLELVEIPD